MPSPLGLLRQLKSVSKLLRGVTAIRTASLEELRTADGVAEIIRRVGLKYDTRDVYGADAAYMNFKAPGLWQIPGQLAPCLVALSACPIRSFLEIGTSVGWTSTVITAYLARFNPELTATTVDIARFFRWHPLVRARVPLAYEHGKTSADFRGQRFDLCFIDGDHSYDWCARDYENVGTHASICMFHDINDDFVSTRPEHHGGVRRFWEELRTREPECAFQEFTAHSRGHNCMGIGLRIKPGAAQGR